MDFHPGFLVHFVIGIQLACHIPEVLARVIQIDDLNRARKMLVGEIPDPFGAVANDYLLFCTAPAPVPGFQIDSFAKLFGCLNRAGIGGRIGIADGINLLSPTLSA